MGDPSNKAKAIFLEAIEKYAPEQWPAFMDEACAADPTLRNRVEQLLKARAELGSFHEDTHSELQATVDEPIGQSAGTMIGHYKLLEPIGEGGMGTVWMAQQSEPIKRIVAIKLIKQGMDSKQVLARFEAERQALALMDHPNIAKVFDAGSTGSIASEPEASATERARTVAYASGSDSVGRPYFVMELVKGVPITKYCDEHHLTPRQRLELFIPVCQAIQHAHQKGIIHRDIKPSNVLVAMYDDRPVPKVIDFGVAKATGQQLTEATLHTGFGAVVGTLEYMSPEQASLSDLDVDTRSDIYSLGVLLYELLAGSPPFTKKELENAGMMEMLRIIREQEPSKPSTKLSSSDALPSLSASRGTEPSRLAKLVRGELDWIVMKALEKDRNRRYETANSFAMDVQRYLADEPVQACPPNMRYRLSKFVRRNKAAIVTAGVSFAAILVVAGSIGWASRDRAARASAAVKERVARQAEMDRERDARRAEIEMDRDRAIDQAALQRDRGNWVESRAATLRAKALVGTDGRADQYERLAQIEKDLAMAARLEDIEIRNAAGELRYLVEDREYCEAFRNYGMDCVEMDFAAIEARMRDSSIREPLLVAFDNWSACRKRISNVGLSGSKSKLGGFQDPQKPKPAITNLAIDLAAVANRVDDDEERKQIRRIVLDGSPIREAVETFANRPEALELRPQSAIHLVRALGRSDRARAILRSAQQRSPSDLRLNLLSASLAKPEPKIGFLRAAIAVRPDSGPLHDLLGTALKQINDAEGAIAAYRVSARNRPDRSLNHILLGNLLKEIGAWEDAIDSFSKAIALKQFGNPFPLRAETYAHLGRWELAAADYMHAYEQIDPEPEQWPGIASIYLLANQHSSHRELCVRIECYQLNRTQPKPSPEQQARNAYLIARCCSLAPDAGVSLQQVVKLAESAVAFDPKAGWYHHTLAMAHYRAGAFDKALASIKESIKIQPGWEAMVCNWLALAMTHHQLGQSDLAREWLAKAVKWIDEGVARAAAKKKVHPIPGIHEHDSLACHVLRREAEKLIGGKRNAMK